MKNKIFFTFLITGFLFSGSAFAQSQSGSGVSVIIVNPGSDQGGTTNSSQTLNCAGEDYNNPACQTQSNPPSGTTGTQLPGQPGGGVFPQIPTTAVNQTNGSINVIDTTLNQQQNSVGLTCSAIKFQSLLDILIWVRCMIGAAVIPLIFALAFIVFLWGIFRFIAASDKAQKEDGKKFILWGLIGLFVMVGVWGIIKIVGSTFGIETGVPYLQTKYLDPSKASTGN